MPVSGFSKSKRIIIVAVTGACILTIIIVIALNIKGREEKTVKDIDWESINTSLLVPEDYKDTADLIEVIQLNTKYILNTWWTMERDTVFYGSNISDLDTLTEEQEEEVRESQESFLNWREEDYLYLANSGASDYSENAIRPLSHACLTLAMALKFNLYDETITGISYDDAVAMTVKLIASVSKMHTSNTENGWGGQWQSALWAEKIGFAAWLLYSEIDTRDQNYIVNMVISEADVHSIDYTVPYYRDENGEIISEGDTKAEENAWNSSILALAVCMLPDHPNNEVWMQKLYELLISSTARPSDVQSDEEVDGFVLSEVLNGSNINEDGTVVNHGRYHIDYMCSEAEGMIETAIIFALAGRSIPSAALFNLDIIYDALVNLDIGIYDEEKEGHHFYERDEKGNASYVINMPGDNDWGDYRITNYFYEDTVADIFNLDKSCPENLKAEDWASVRVKRIKDMVNRETDGEITGQLYQEGENVFGSGETFAMNQIAEAYVLRRLNADGMFKF